MNPGSGRRLFWSFLGGVGCSVLVVGSTVLSSADSPSVALLAGLIIGTVAAGTAGPFFGVTIATREARRAQAKDATKVEELGAPLVHGDGERPPSGYLDPRHELVDFVGRRGELAELIAWCEQGDGSSVRLVTGPGGVGKTRLAVQLRRRLEEVGWRCVMVADGAETTAVSRVRSAYGGRLLLIADYAETRVGLSALLREVAAASGTVRVLLLARSAGDWWERLKVGDAGVRALVGDAGSAMSLSVTVEDGVSATELVRTAVARFAAQVGVQAPAHTVVEPGDEPARILDLHAAALTAVLRAANERDDPRKETWRVQVSGVMDELLRHEMNFWMGSSQRAGLLDGADGMPAQAIRGMVAAVCLLGAASEEEALGLLKRVPGAVPSSRVARWLREVYPPYAEVGAGDVEWLGALQPDRLAERHTVTELLASPELARSCLRDLSDRQSLRAVTLLGRASAEESAATPLLERVLPLVERVVAQLPPDTALLSAISAAIPYPTVSLAAADAALHRRIVMALPSTRSAERAFWLSASSSALSQVGSSAEALSADQEALSIYRELEREDPARYRPDLANTLSNLGVTLVELGRPSEASPVLEEAVSLYRNLAQDDSAHYRPSLAQTLSNLGGQLTALGHTAAAFAVAEESVSIHRDLVQDAPDRYRPRLASALNVFCVTHVAMGKVEEMRPLAEEAVSLYRGLTQGDPDRYRPDFAKALTVLGSNLVTLGLLEEALPLAEEAVLIYRELAHISPDRYRPELANHLTMIAATLLALEQSNEAFPVAAEAVDIFRSLAQETPERYRSILANSLTVLGAIFTARNLPRDGHRVMEEAVSIRRELAQENAERYRPELASSLFAFGATLSELERWEEAISVEREAVSVYREMVQIYPDRYRDELAETLGNLSISLSHFGYEEEAERVRIEAERVRAGEQ